MEEHGIEGTIKIFGTPGEKLAIGKPFLASYGFFDGLDAVVGQHPWHINAVTWDYHFDPYMVVDFRFHGKYNYVFLEGRSAVDALVMMISSIGNRKVVPVSSMNKVILVGGQTLEFYSEYAEVMFSFGAKKRSELDKILGVLIDCAEAAAKVTKCTYQMRSVGGNRSYLPNHALAELVHRNLELVGPPRFTEEEKEFCRQIQESMGMVPEDEPLDETIMPMGEGLKDDPYMVSFDDGNEISWYAPFQWFNVACSPKYSEPWIPCATVGTTIGSKAAIIASKVLACNMLDLLTVPSELERCRVEFKSRISGRGGPEAPIIPPGTKPPIDLPLPEFTGKETIIRYPTEGRTPLI
jgi:aminobenzoyl-glutamate utilization protein B